MCNINDDILPYIRCHLRDPLIGSDGKVWKTNQLKGYIKQAITHLVALRPDLFSVTREFVLSPGQCSHSFCNHGCTKVLSVISVDGYSCDINEEDDDDKDDDKSLSFLEEYFNDEECETDVPTTDDRIDVGEWRKADNSQCTIVFENPVPNDGKEHKVEVSCVEYPDLDSNELPDVLCDQLFDPMMNLIFHMAYLADHQSNTNIKLAEAHYERYQSFIQLHMLVDYAGRQPDWFIFKRETTST